MDQSKSNSEKFIPKRTLTLEFLVGIFSLVALLCGAYLAVGLGGLDLNKSNEYLLYAEFDDVSGLKSGASVEIAGVQIGEVVEIKLAGDRALTTLKINKPFELQDDDIALVRTKGIIGDRYVKISRGASGAMLKPGEKLSETESVVDIEDIIGKIVHTFTKKDETEAK